MTEEIKEILSIVSEGQDSIQRQQLVNYITNLQKENEEFYQLMEMQNKREYRSKFLKDFQKEHGENVFPDYDEIYKKYDDYKSRNEKAIEYIKKDTRWFDSEYAKIYGMLCDCEGAKGDRLEVLVNPTNLLNILKGGDEEWKDI